MSLLAELKRRKVFKVGAAYLVVGWLVIEVAATILPQLNFPEWAPRLVTFLVLLGLPIAVVLAWVYEVTPDGIKLDAKASGSKRVFAAAAVLAILVLGWFLHARVLPAPAIAAPSPAPSLVANAKPRAAAESIAVLPFVNMSTDPENEFFSDGLSEEILNSLARIDGMQVVGRTSSFQFKGKNEDLRDIGEKLGVAHVLEGSVRREGNKARITAQLIRTSDGIHLWSQTYDRMLDDILAVQLDIAENVASVLNVVMDDKQRSVMRKSGVKNVDAFIHYQKGWKLYADAHRDPAVGLLDGLRLANAEFQQAVALEPRFSFAHYAQADLHEHILIDDGTTQAQRLEAQQAALETLARAAATSPDAQQRELALAERQMLSDDWRGLSARIDTALSQSGCSAPNWLPVFASMYGFGDKLDDVLKRATACDPLNSISRATRIWVARANGNGARMQALFAQWRRDQPQLTQSPNEALSRALNGGGDEARVLLGSIADPDADDLSVALVLARRSGGQATDAGAMLQPSDPARAKIRQWEIVALDQAALFGTRDEANRAAAKLDGRPAGGLLLTVAMTYCGCGVPFDLSATPNFKARLAESGLRWPPKAAILYPPPAPDARR